MCVFVSVVHPVAILSAVFCVICSLLMFVSDAIGQKSYLSYRKTSYDSNHIHGKGHG